MTFSARASKTMGTDNPDINSMSRDQLMKADKKVRGDITVSNFTKNIGAGGMLLGGLLSAGAALTGGPILIGIGLLAISSGAFVMGSSDSSKKSEQQKKIQTRLDERKPGMPG